MKSPTWLLAMALFHSVAGHAAVAETGQGIPEYKVPGWQAAPGNIKDWADRCSDFTVNGWGFKDPKNFVKLVELFSDPAIYLEFAQRMQDPEAYVRMLSQMLDPATAKNYLEWGDPVIYTKWSAAMFDPNFLMSVLRPGLDMGTYMRWGTVPLDTRWWAVAMNTMNPALWAKWMAAPLNPKVMEPLYKAADPNTSLKWAQALSDPGNLQGWSRWTAPFGDQPAGQGSSGSGAQPNASPNNGQLPLSPPVFQPNSFNMFNPATWLAPFVPGAMSQGPGTTPSPTAAAQAP